MEKPTNKGFHAEKRSDGAIHLEFKIDRRVRRTASP